MASKLYHVSTSKSYMTLIVKILTTHFIILHFISLFATNSYDIFLLFSVLP